MFPELGKGSLLPFYKIATLGIGMKFIQGFIPINLFSGNRYVVSPYVLQILSKGQYGNHNFREKQRSRHFPFRER